jgi:hypothetical protein
MRAACRKSQWHKLKPTDVVWQEIQGITLRLKEACEETPSTFIADLDASTGPVDLLLDARE